MTTVADPIIGSWYKDVENNLKFKVVAIDEMTIQLKFNTLTVISVNTIMIAGITQPLITSKTLKTGVRLLTILKPMIWAIQIPMNTSPILKIWILKIIWNSKETIA